ncbi:MAG: CDP-alcohol phosphatidyltransferase family protein [Bacteroidales bacterium]|uniref:CDP-alcohol phosphatidyltransferase family protein n=1 Tax=Porphyromonas sp. TaxID=1924944 RepID=UPI0029748981|nr:CDP-alcohol phosphatidyltransferase family protein [Porphyromonas sp.]MDD7437384.1 CDP-alcohol phosphatidyltransferase family protein [Bacteroidales bacterium]MDY3066452.1 CDP-alcohol phosphatidyltransferase family protein [Porphyromonas sp.]
MKIKKHIPNLISLSNALFGSIAIYFALGYRNIDLAIISMIIAAVMDFFDGFSARKLQAFSPLGKDIDSLCDVISFGMAPAAMMVVALVTINFPFPVIALVIVPASVYRLAKFNHDTRQTVSFIGLPTPANALLLSGLAHFTFTNATAISSAPLSIIYKVYPAYAIVLILLAYLLISEIPMFSLKGSNTLSRKGHLFRIGSVVVAGIIGVIFWSYTGLAIAMGLYLLINLWDYFKHRAG